MNKKMRSTEPDPETGGGPGAGTNAMVAPVELPPPLTNKPGAGGAVAGM